MKFEKVSFYTFKNDLEKCLIHLGEKEAKEFYESIKLPERKKLCSAGYDFYTTIPFYLNRNSEMIIPTGIKCYFPDDVKGYWCLKLYPISSLSITYGIVLRNLVGIIDANYYNNSENEGDILIALHNNNGMSKQFESGERVMQGLFVIYGITTYGMDSGCRIGEVGSTGR